MNTSDLIKELCKDRHMSIAEVARRMGQTPQNLNKKLMRDTVTYGELLEIADVMGVSFEQAFRFSDGKRIILEMSTIRYVESNQY